MFMLSSIDQRRTKIVSETSAARKSELGQFMTPTSIAQFMSCLLPPPFFWKATHLTSRCRSGDCSLSAAFASRALKDQAQSLGVEVWEIDSKLIEPLTQRLQGRQKALQESGGTFCFTSKQEDFINTFNLDWFKDQSKVFTHAILNRPAPPY